MKKEITIVILVCFLIVSSTNVVGEVINSSKKSSGNKNLDVLDFSENRIVLVEYFSSSMFSGEDMTSDQLYNLYASGNYDFQYVTLVTDKSKVAENRSQELGVHEYPSVFFDGGYRILPGEQGNITPYIDALNESDSREVDDVSIQLEAYWTQCPCHKDIAGEIRVINNMDREYNGRLIISVVEIDSRWQDRNGRPYNYVILDYIVDKKISIDKAPLGMYETEYFWYAAGAGFPGLDRVDAANLLVVASVFSDYSGFADKTVTSRLFKDEPPSKPNKPQGIAKGKPGETYTYTTYSTDPDSDEIQYGWDWDGDFIVDEWTQYYPSGQEINISHIWDEKDTYNIRVKARDKLLIKSFWSDPLSVSISLNKNRHYSLSSFLEFLLKYSSFINVLKDMKIFEIEKIL